MWYTDVLRVLLKKNIKLSLRDYVSLAIQICTPFFVTLILFISQQSFDNGLGFEPEALEELNPPIEPLGRVPSCHTLRGEPCTSLLYVDSGDPRVEGWVETLATSSGIDLAGVRRQESSEAVNEFLLANKNNTLAAIIFEESDIAAINNGDISFVVQYNHTEQIEFPIGDTQYNDDFVVPSITVSLTEIIMADVLGRDVSLTINKRAFPHPNLAEAGDAYEFYGTLLLFGTYTVSMIFFLYKIVEEKEKRLREAMRMAGMVQSQHFISWGSLFVVLMAITGLLLIAFGYIFRFNFFTETDFGVIFITFFIFGNALVAWTFLLSTVIRKSSSVNSVAFVFYIVGYILGDSQELIYGSSPDGEPFLSGGAIRLREIFAILPSTMFNRCVQTIARAAKLGGGVRWEDIGGVEGDPTNVFPIRTCWLWMVLSSLVVFLLAVYLDNIIGSGFGKKLPFYYCFTLSYWRPKKSVSSDLMDANNMSTPPVDTTGDEPQNSLVHGLGENEEDQDVQKEREAITSGVKNESNCAVVVKGIRKEYSRLTAVDDVYMSIAHGSLFCLLGHNGAGKSTLFSMLTGVTPVTSGDAEIYGRSVRGEQEAIRSILGVCPQHDILWDSLTCAEHIEIYSALKGIQKTKHAEEIELRLSQVELYDVRDKYSGNMSGGMQRRLSVAIALTGDPRIVFLDEPTTGMDPVSRRQVWSMIEGAKKGRVIVLVTHSMEEADVLGDNVGIMARGKLRVIGTPIHLKAKFGAGYKLVALSNKSNTTDQAVSSLSPESQVVESKPTPAGAVITEYAIPRSDTSRLRTIVQTIEQQMAQIGLISFSISESTLEEVFLKITGLWVDEDQGPSTRTKCFCC